MHRSAFLLGLLLIVPALAVEPPYPEPVEGEFEIRQWRVGDAGRYVVGSAEDTGNGFRRVAEDAELLRFEMLEPTTAMGQDAYDVPAFAFRMQHAGWTRDDWQARPMDEDVFVRADGAPIGMFRPNAGYGSAGETTWRYEHTYAGTWGDAPCWWQTPLVDGIDLATPVELPSCRLMGDIRGGTFEAVARMQVGPRDAVVFHQARDATRQGEAWIWFAPDLPLPLAYVEQDASRPQRFTVMLLSDFGAGDRPAVLPTQAGTPWPALERAAWGRFGPPDPAGSVFPIEEALDLLLESEEGEELAKWLEDERAYLARSDESGWQSDNGNTTRTRNLAFVGEGRLASATVTEWNETPWPVDPRPLLGEETSGLDIEVAMAECECPVLSLEELDARLPVPGAVQDRWAVWHEGPADTWSFERRCADAACEHVSYRISAGHRETRDERATGGGFVHRLDELTVQGNGYNERHYGHTPSMVFLATRTSDAERPSDAPLQAVLGADVLSLLTTLPDRDPAPRQTDDDERAAIEPGEPVGFETTDGPPHAPEAATMAWTPGRPALVATAGAVVGGMVLWLLFSKLALAGFFTRIRKDRVLDTELRAQIHDLVASEPGIHLNEIARRTDRQRGVVRHHLDKLIDAGLVDESSAKGFTMFSAKGALDRTAKQGAADVPLGPRRAILMELGRAGSASPSALAKHIGVAPATVSYHLRRLREAGLVTIQRTGARGTVSPTPLGRDTWRALGGKA